MPLFFQNASDFRARGWGTLSEQHLEADVSGEVFDPARHTIFTEIKAVTFHDLQLERDERGWKVEIIFDL